MIDGCFINESPRVSLDSFDTKAQKNADGSIDVYFGPKAPAGHESNWVYTAPNQPCSRPVMALSRTGSKRPQGPLSE